MAPSTKDLSPLPDLAGFRRLTQALATLDAVICADWESRYYSFNAGWGPGQAMASMRDGCGDHWFALLSDAGVALVGLAHEAPSYRPDHPADWLFATLPTVWDQSLVHEPAFECDNASVCLWREAGDDAWRCGRDPNDAIDDGSAELLAMLAGDPRQYVEFAAEYFEVELELADVAAVYAGTPMTPALARRLAPDVDLDALWPELDEIGYPIAREP